MKTIVYVANADSHDIAVLAFEPTTGKLADVQRFATGGAVMPLAVRAAASPRTLYASIRSEPYTVLSLGIDPATGRLSETGRAPLPASMCWISTDRRGRFLLSASYGSSLVAVGPIDARGVAQAAAQVLATPTNAHSIQVDPSNRFAFAACLGGGALRQMRFAAENGVLVDNDPAAWTARAGSGPRHFVFHPSGAFVYLLNELDASIDVLAFDAELGLLELVQTIAMLPSGVITGAPWAADVHLTPDGRFLYASERRSSTIAAFTVDAASGRLTAAGHVPTEAEPRGFAITPDGDFLLSVGQASHRLSLYAIDAGKGRLEKLGDRPIGTNPNWVEIVSLPG